MRSHSLLIMLFKGNTKDASTQGTAFYKPITMAKDEMGNAFRNGATGPWAAAGAPAAGA